MCGTAMRGADALPGSKATSRAKMKRASLPLHRRNPSAFFAAAHESANVQGFGRTGPSREGPQSGRKRTRLGAKADLRSDFADRARQRRPIACKLLGVGSDN